MNTAGQADSATTVYQRKLYEDRWSAYGSNTGILNISDKLSAADLKRLPLFRDYDDKFLNQLTPDISVARWKAGAVLFEEGSYLDLAFFIVEGRVDVHIHQHEEASPKPIFRTAPGTVGDPRPSGSERQTLYGARAASQRQRQTGEGSGVTYLATMDFDLETGQSVRLKAGDIFGEIGALNGWPQSVTARTASECTLVQIRLPALREMKKKSDALKTHLDRIYRERTLFAQLKTTPLFQGLEDNFITALTQRVELVSSAPGDVITQEGEAADALYMVRSGFLRVTQRLGEGEVVVTYLSKGMTLGEAEMLIEGITDWQSTTTAVGHTELVKIPATDFFRIAQRYPAIERRLWETTVARIKEAGHTRKNLDKAELIDFALMNGLVQGNSILLMDLDVCTRCDDCVRGCASTHGGRPRFVREGEKYENFLIARSCYHCEDPVCLIGCPTGAIQRANVAEVVKIDDNLCIGCSNCANKCPYDAIVMHDTGQTWPDTALPEWLRGRPRKVASKCDLCHESSAGPACVNNCPHACAFRISSIEEFQQLLDAGSLW